VTAPPVVTDERPVLRSLVGDVEQFLHTTFGQVPWRGTTPSHGHVLDLDDVDRIVASAVRVPAIRMIQDGERIAPQRFCSTVRIGSTSLDDVADVRKVLDLYRRGATIVLQSLHRTWPPVSAWCADLERELGWPVQANAYLTPPGERGLAPHRDGHDVLVLQQAGTKAWHVDGLDPLTLCVGEVLYLPAGTEHQAHTLDESSLHLTVGVHRPTAERIAKHAASMAMARAVPAGESPAQHIAALRVALQDVTDEEVVADLRRGPRIDESGLLAAAARRPAIDGRTVVAAAVPWTLEPSSDDRVTMRWPRGVLELPQRTRPALELLSAGTPVEVERLPGLDAAERVVLVRRLLDEGAAAPARGPTGPSSGSDAPVDRP